MKISNEQQCFARSRSACADDCVSEVPLRRCLSKEETLSSIACNLKETFDNLSNGAVSKNSCSSRRSPSRRIQLVTDSEHLSRLSEKKWYSTRTGNLLSPQSASALPSSTSPDCSSVLNSSHRRRASFSGTTTSCSGFATSEENIPADSNERHRSWPRTSAHFSSMRRSLSRKLHWALRKLL